MNLKRSLLLAWALLSNLALASSMRLVSGECYDPYTGSALPSGELQSELVIAALGQASH